MNCERCGKRLSRKTARTYGGEVLCSTCLFAPLDALRDTQPAQVGRNPKGGDAKQGSVEDEHAVPNDSEGCAQRQSPPGPESLTHDR